MNNEKMNIMSSQFLKMSDGAIRISSIKAVRKYWYQDSFQIEILYGIEEAFVENFTSKKTRDKAYDIILRVLDGDVSAMPELESVLTLKDEEPEDTNTTDSKVYGGWNNAAKKSGFLSKLLGYL